MLQWDRSGGTGPNEDQPGIQSKTLPKQNQTNKQKSNPTILEPKIPIFISLI